jgi:hypothetical protein
MIQIDTFIYLQRLTTLIVRGLYFLRGNRGVAWGLQTKLLTYWGDGELEPAAWLTSRGSNLRVPFIT